MLSQRVRLIVAVSIAGGLLFSVFSSARAQIAVPTAPSPGSPQNTVPIPGVLESVRVLQYEYESRGTPEDPCSRDSSCPMPAATLIEPAMGQDVVAGGAVITGLSWNDTRVDIYIDGTYDGRATLREDESGVGDFYHRPLKPLSLGEHSVYSVVRNVQETERSKPSPTVRFRVVSELPLVLGAEKMTQADTKTSQGAAAPRGTAMPKKAEPGEGDEQSADEVLENFFASGSVTATTTATSTRGLGGSLLVAIIVAALVIGAALFVWASRRRPPSTPTGTSETGGQTPTMPSAPGSPKQQLPLDEIPPPPF